MSTIVLAVLVLLAILALMAVGFFASDLRHHRKIRPAIGRFISRILNIISW
jgi:Tfp pilus assembly protein FimT